MATRQITPMNFDDTVTETNTLPYQGSNAWSGLAGASLFSSMAGNYSQLQSDLDMSKSLEYQATRYSQRADRSRLAAQAARSQTKLNNTILQEQYNETQANQAVMFAMQGRTGGTVANIIKQDTENLNWDKKFMELSGIMEATNLELDATGYDIDATSTRSAAAQGIRSAYNKSAMGLLSSVADTAKIV